MSSHPVAADSGLSLLSAPDQLQLNDDFRGEYMSSSPSLSPLACKYESRLRAPSTKRQRTRPPLTLSSENGDSFNYSDFRTDTSLSLSSRSLFSLPSDRESWSTRSDTAALFRFNSGRSSTCHSDRFVSVVFDHFSSGNRCSYAFTDTTCKSNFTTNNKQVHSISNVQQ